MPPKKEERKPLEPIFQEIPLFYEYIDYSNEQMEQLNEYLNYFKPELSAIMKNNIFENMELLSQTIRIAIHPSFIKPNQIIDLNDFDENTKFRNPEDLDGDQVPQMIQINSIKIDLYTLKLLDYCAGISGLTTIKLSNNSLTSRQYQQLAAIINNPENKIKKLFIDWQEVDESFLQQVQQVEFLTLRSCQLTNKQIQSLTSDVQNLKCLDLYDNRLSREALNLIGKMLGQNGSMEFLGLAKNGIQSFDDLQGITQNIGRFQMSQEEYEEYKTKEKERDAIIERNKKVKKKGTEEPVPFLESIQQIDNNWYLIKNSKLCLINLSMNQIDDQSRDAIEKFLLQTGENFQLVLMNNRFDDQKALQKTKKKFGKKLVL
ncbi:unnamed protein product (macronuclear) [Paramecium tetraurelia]|uniref:Uncharacterized protein n=1 Tax=Paramecium tetraurelia TaxID=5888 RepID=A0DWR0_PARTE|nr:uncharacterized protein GSPATT00021120001 [Paramecium tetraurelia]CAK87477.1 unnamed protein product [Paramecium tetraurelia]|eukprot:XP_001454874.1 hypothetical protein (macronuclear) [Paramecium tetraurelia strain d4-2]